MDEELYEQFMNGSEPKNQEDPIDPESTPKDPENNENEPENILGIKTLEFFESRYVGNGNVLLSEETFQHLVKKALG